MPHLQKAIRTILLAVTTILALSSCRTSAPNLNYKALAKASIQLGVDIDLNDNHKLYVEAAKWIGTPYRTGGTSKRGTDCSGLVCQLYRSVYRTKLPRTTQELRNKSRKIGKRQLQEGDLVFFSSPRSRKKTAHVGIYLKEGKFIHASSSQGVIVSRLNEEYYTKYWLAGGRVR